MTDQNEYRHINITAENVHLGNTYISGKLEELTATDLITELFLTDAFNDLSKTLRLKGKRVDGTCEWLLAKDEYKTWVSGDDFQILWLIGDAGTGKTVISCFLIDRMKSLGQESQPTNLIYYLCDNKDEKRRTATSILRGILVQMLQNQPELFDVVKADYKMRRGSVAKNLECLWTYLVRILKTCTVSTYILIDALDECESASRRDLIALLTALELSTKARFFITTRPESSMREADCVSTPIYLDSTDIGGDLGKFIDTKIDDIKRIKQYPDKLIQDITETVRERTGGTFLWASFVLNDILATTTTRAARKKLESMPSDLPGVYGGILNNIGKENEDDAILVLQWVVVSKRPMTVTELATAVALQDPDAREAETVPPAEALDELKDIFKSCGALLYHDKSDGTVNLIHQSAKDYLETLDPLSTYYVHRESAQMGMIRTCWSYLSKQEFQKGAVVLSRNERNELSPVKLSQRFIQLYGFTLYAAEELLDVEDFGRNQGVITTLVSELDSLDKIPGLRDFWLITFGISGHAEGVGALLKKGADLTARLEAAALDSPLLHLSAMDGHEEVCRVLIDNGVDIEATEEVMSATALHCAAANGHQAVVALLLERGACKHKQDRYGRTALYWALENEHEDTALLLIDANSESKPERLSDQEHGDRTLTSQRGMRSPSFYKDPEATGTHLSDLDADFYTDTDSDVAEKSVAEMSVTEALNMAARAGFCRVAERLITAGATVDTKCEFTCTALYYGVHTGNVELSKLLLDAGADIGLRNEYGGETYLHMAAYSNDVGMLEMLLDRNVDTNATTERFEIEARGDSYLPQTALSIVSQSGNLEAVETLIRGGASLGVQEDENTPALHFAARNSHKSVVRYLLDIGVCPSLRDNTRWRRMPIHLAASGGNDAIVDLLLQWEVTVEDKDEEGWTPLHYAVYGKQTSMVSHLIKRKGADIAARTNQQQTALHLISQGRLVNTDDDYSQRTLDIFRLLLKEKVDVNATDSDGRAALHGVVAVANLEAATILLDYDADIDATDSNGMTALHIVPGNDSSILGKLKSRQSRDESMDQSLATTQLLLDRGANFDAPDNMGRTVLFMAAASENYRLVKLLLQYGSEPSKMNGAGPATYPKFDKLRECVKQWRSSPSTDCEDPAESVMLHLLSEMAIYTLASEDPTIAWFHKAAHGGYATVVSMLVSREDVGDTLTSVDISSSLTAAAKAGCGDVVRILLETDMSMDPTIEFSDALRAAVGADCELAVLLILQRTLEVYPENDYHWLQLRNDMWTGSQHMMNMMLEYTIDTWKQDYLQNPFEKAIHAGWVDTVQKLLDHGINVNGHGDYWSPLHEAARCGQIAVAELLVSRGAEVNIEKVSRSDTLFRPLTCALLFADMSMVSFLVEHGADATTIPRADHELVRCAMESKPEDVLNFLELVPENFELEGDEGQELLTWAVEMEYTNVVNGLLEKGVEMDVEACTMNTVVSRGRFHRPRL